MKTIKHFFSFIRWKFVIPVTLILAGLIIFFVLFFDPLLKRGIEKVASNANGAKVDIAHLKTSFLNGRIDIGGLQVTDSSDFMKNIVEIGSMSFQLELSEIASKRVIIDEASLKNLAFNTKRSVSGKLPRPPKKVEDEKPGFAEKLFDTYKGRFSVSLDGMKSQAKAKIEFDPKTLTITKTADDIKLRATEFPDKWKTNVDDLKVEERLKKVELDLKSLKEMKFDGVDAVTELPAALKKLQTSKNELNAIKSDIKKSKESFSSEVKGFKNSVTLLKEAKNKDIADLKSRLNLDFADPKKLMETVIGPAVLQNFHKGLTYVEMVRKHMPSQKEKESIPEKPRLKGMDIKFWSPAAPPTFWLKNATLSGAFEDLTAAGTITHLTSDPTRVGKPLMMNLTGEKGEVEFDAKAVLDHVGDNDKDTLSVKGHNLSLDQFLSAGELGNFISGGTGSADFTISLEQFKQMSGTLNLSVKNFNVNKETLYARFGVDNPTSQKIEDSLKIEFANSLVKSIESIPVLTIDANLSGSLTDPKMDFSSNLTEAFSSAIKSSVSATLQKGQAELEAKLNAIVNEKKAELDVKIAESQEKINALLSKLDADTQTKIQEATGINLSSIAGQKSPLGNIKIPSLDNFFKKK